MSLYSYPVMCPRTKGKNASGDIFIGIDSTTGKFILAIECDTCRERHHFPTERLVKEVKKILEEENIDIPS